MPAAGLSSASEVPEVQAEVREGEESAEAVDESGGLKPPQQA